MRIRIAKNIAKSFVLIILLAITPILFLGCGNNTIKVQNPYGGCKFYPQHIAYKAGDGSNIIDVVIKIENLSDSGQNFNPSNFQLVVDGVTRDGKRIYIYGNEKNMGNIPLAAHGTVWITVDFKQDITDYINYAEAKSIVLYYGFTTYKVPIYILK